MPTDIIRLILTQPRSLLLVLSGLLLCLLSALGSMPVLNVTSIDTPGRLFLGLLGLAGIAGAIFFRDKSDIAPPGWYGIQFTIPQKTDETVSSLFTVKGNFKRKPPEGALRIFVVSENREKWWPIAEATLNDNDSTWSAEVTFDLQKEDYKTLVVAALVEKNNTGLIQYFRELPRYLEDKKYERKNDYLFNDIMPYGIKKC
jgi:hypothetical protein